MDCQCQWPQSIVTVYVEGLGTGEQRTGVYFDLCETWCLLNYARSDVPLETCALLLVQGSAACKTSQRTVAAAAEELHCYL
jgi:hypothetical protein